MGELDINEVMCSVDFAFENGITTFDVADVYGLGLAESNLRKALGKRINRSKIITKCGVRWDHNNSKDRAITSRDNSPIYIERAVNESLTRLAIDSIDLFFVHWPDNKTPIEDLMECLLRLQKTGKIKEFGLSNFSFEQLFSANKISKFKYFQDEFNLLTPREKIDNFHHLENNGLNLLGYGPLLQGFLSGKYDSSTKFSGNDRRKRENHFQSDKASKLQNCLVKLENVSEKYQLSVPEIAIHWCLSHSFLDSVILGIKNIKQCELALAVNNNDIDYSFVDDYLRS